MEVVENENKKTKTTHVSFTTPSRLKYWLEKNH